MRRSPPSFAFRGSAAEPRRATAEIGRSSGGVSRLKRQLALAQALGNIGVWHYDFGSEYMSWSDDLCRIMDVPADRPVTVEFFLSLLAPVGRKKLQSWFLNAIGASDPVRRDDPLLHATRKVRLGQDHRPVALRGRRVAELRRSGETRQAGQRRWKPDGTDPSGRADRFGEPSAFSVQALRIHQQCWPRIPLCSAVVWRR